MEHISKPLNNSIKALSLFIMILIFLYYQSCSEEIYDTCIQGENMTNIRLIGEFDPSSEKPTLVIGWNIGSGIGSKLPDEYFNEVKVAEETGYEVSLLIDNVTYTNHYEITISFRNLIAFIDSNNTLIITLEFPDRRDFINCDHPGMDDRYLLIIELSFDTQKNFIDVQFKQRMDAGPI